ncbi:hypothetical protein EVAR_14937_1 [Eumeta japonica]|uniref:Uncharacterized protein n=1 Tax=Eumeta variegata TaxID=151549 RepID=A0A4C1XLN7_EUMVA|nr:hypothetical protein EVAR_14937_1 [Eumeta japonica]
MARNLASFLRRPARHVPAGHHAACNVGVDSRELNRAMMLGSMAANPHTSASIDHVLHALSASVSMLLLSPENPVYTGSDHDN